MWLLIAGFVMFLGAHLSPGVLGLREQLVGRLGEGRFLGVYIAISVIGMVCIMAGKAIAPVVNVWDPPAWGHQAALVLVALGFILLANGDLASMILFGGFGGYSVLSIWSLNRRGAHKKTTRYPVWQDVVTVAAGVGGYAVLLWAHPYLFGVRVPGLTF